MKFLKACILPLLLIVACGLLLRSTYVEVKTRAIVQLNSQQLVMAETAARGIESFFEHYGELLAEFAGMREIASLDEPGRQLMQILYRTHANAIKGVSRVSPSGHILYTFPEIPGAIGADLSSQEHIQTIMQTHQPVVSDVFDSVQGYVTIAFHVPVFENGLFQGSLAVLIPFDQLSRKYLEPIKIGKDGYAWIINQKGIELYCPVPGHIGKSVFDNCQDFPSILAMAREMVKGNRGTTSYVFDRVRGEIVESLHKQAVYVPVCLGTAFWSIVVATPEDEVLENIQGFRDRWFLIIGVLILILIVWMFYRLRAFKILKEEEKRKRAEESLRETSETLQAIFAASPVAIMALDRQGNVIKWSPAAERIFGGSEQEVVGRFNPIVPEDKFDEFWADFTQVIGGQEFSAAREVRRRKHDGVLIDIRLSTAPLRNAAGAIIGAVGIMDDISERKRAESQRQAALEALGKSESMMRAITDSAQDAIVMMTPTGRISFWNPAAEEIFGYTTQEASGRLLHSFLAPKRYLEAYYTAFSEFKKTGQGKVANKTIELQAHRKNGEEFPIELSLSAIQHEDGWHAVGIIRDITSRKRMEQERQELRERLYRAEKMEALGTLAGGVAHDLNNVLGVLVGYSELLLEKMPQDSPMRKYVANILKSGEWGAAIIQDLLTLARRGVAISEVLNLNRIISDYCRTNEFERLNADHAGVTFSTDLDNDLMNIRGSPAHLGKTMMNLLANAAEAIEGRGEISIQTANCYLDRPVRGYDTILEGDYVVLTVADNGKGIAPADLGKIFEPFYTKKVMGRSGTGLGLAVVWGTVKDHGGYIDVLSNEGKGSTFRIYFPVTREELSTDRQRLSPDHYLGKGESILVVDDVEGQRELAISMLTRLGYRAHAVAGGEEAVAYLKSEEVDLLVLDMIMDPGIDGLETYQRVLEIRPRRKAIIVSGFSETDRVKKAQTLGAGAYVKKPYVLERLGLAVRRELDRLA